MSETKMIWVEVDRAAALGHPKGKPGLALWGIIGFLVLRAGWFATVAGAYGGTFLWVQVAVMLVLVAALVLRMPVAFPLMILHMLLVLVWFVRTLESVPEIVPLVDIAVHVAIVGYMLEGVRPNLIYRYRFRANRPLEDGDAD